MRRPLAVAATIAALALAACGDDDEQTDAPEAEPAAEATAPSNGSGEDGKVEEKSKPAEKPSGITITTADSQFGEILFDADDRAIYLFDKEQGSESECYGDCAAAWPPVLTDGEPQVGGAAKRNLLGTTERDDGSTQVTYAGHPLYYYVDDPPGQVLCHNVSEFGGLWLVLEASGDAVS